MATCVMFAVALILVVKRRVYSLHIYWEWTIPTLTVLLSIPSHPCSFFSFPAPPGFEHSATYHVVDTAMHKDCFLFTIPSLIVWNTNNI
ncbi:hypothetical protein BC830DRAFT_719328 [Chytriomyces sp. MP71]|nr:hypothetical protein BC830DRAFT_719328 [Chytriomyces sp. MP71]